LLNADEKAQGPVQVNKLRGQAERVTKDVPEIILKTKLVL
jgi:hypothetical protein